MQECETRIRAAAATAASKAGCALRHLWLNGHLQGGLGAFGRTKTRARDPAHLAQELAALVGVCDRGADRRRLLGRADRELGHWGRLDANSLAALGRSIAIVQAVAFAAGLFAEELSFEQVQSFPVGQAGGRWLRRVLLVCLWS